MIIYYFTGTGNSLKAARDIAAKCGGEVRPMREAVTEHNPQDAVGFVFPVYHSGLPNMVEL